MTLYCQVLDELPPNQMARLGPGSRSTHFWESDAETGADVERYTYVWRDLQVDLFITRPPYIASQVEDFVGYAASLARAGRHALDPDFVRRIRATRLVIGYVAGPDIGDNSRFERLEDLILTLCHATGSLLFWEGRIYDENGGVLLG